MGMRLEVESPDDERSGRVPGLTEAIICMRKVFTALFAMLLLVGASAGAVSAQKSNSPAAGKSDATPAASPATEHKTASKADVNPVNPQIGDAITYFAANGDAIGTIKVTNVERNWEGYDKYDEPEAGTEYIAVTIEAESTISRGAMEVDPYDFSLQDSQSFLWGRSYVNTPEGDKPASLTDKVRLASGEKAEFLMIFQVYVDQPLANVYWSPKDHLLTLADLTRI